MRHASRRSFTVEIKSGSGRRTTTIPDRLTAFTPSPPSSPVEAEPEASAPSPEPRRILPNLIVPEPQQAEPEPMLAVEELPLRRPRGRPRKLRPDPVDLVAEAVLPNAPEPAPVPTAAEVRPLPVPAARKPKRRPALDLARGEQWKRRLGRWSRQ